MRAWWVGLSMLMACGSDAQSPRDAREVGDQVGADERSDDATVHRDSGLDRNEPATQAGDALRDAASALDSGGNGNVASQEDAGTAHLAGYTMRRVIAGGPWMAKQQAIGMAVDSQERLYIVNEDTLYQVANGKTTVHLVSGDLAQPDDRHCCAMLDVDVGPSDALYVLTGTKIFRVDAAHQATLYRTLPVGSAGDFLGVIDDDNILVAGSSAGVMLSERTGARRLFRTEQGFGTGCATEDFAAHRDNSFVYSPGCNGSPLFVRQRDEALFERKDLRQLWSLADQPISGDFDCLTRDPAGGWLGIAELRSEDGLRLLHSGSASTPDAWVELPVKPTFKQAADTSGIGPFDFMYCAIAASKTGTIFFQTYHQIWELKPL